MTVGPMTRNGECKKFSPNIFNKSKCTNCFRQKEEHSAEALESNRVSDDIIYLTIYLPILYFTVANRLSPIFCIESLVAYVPVFKFYFTYIPKFINANIMIYNDGVSCGPVQIIYHFYFETISFNSINVSAFI